MLASSLINLGQDCCLLSLLPHSDYLYGYSLSWVGINEVWYAMLFAIHLVLECRSAADQCCALALEHRLSGLDSSTFLGIYQYDYC